MGLYDRDYMRADKRAGDPGLPPEGHSRFPAWVAFVALIVIVAFLLRAC